MHGHARIHGFQLFAPPGQQAQTFDRRAHFVAQIVGPAAIGVDIVEILMQALREQEADHLEVFVVMRGQPAGVGFGFGSGVAGGSRLGRLDKLPGRQQNHGIIAVFRWPLWLIKWRITSSRLASGSSLLTKSREVMSPRVTRSSALRIY